jgi:hypothetical protein
MVLTGGGLPIALLRTALLLCCTFTCVSFPVFYGANGTTLVTSGNGGDVVLQPNGGGASVASAWKTS